MKRNKKFNENDKEDAIYRLKLKKALKVKWKEIPIKIRRMKTKKLEILCRLWGIKIDEL